MGKFLSKTRFNPHSNDQIIMLTEEEKEALDIAMGNVESKEK